MRVDVAMVVPGMVVAFGGIMVAWADQRFAHRFAGGPAPAPAPKYGWPAVRYEFGLWLRCIVAWVITAVLLIGLIALVNDADNTRNLEQWFRIACASIVLWFVFGPAWSLVFFKREPQPS